MKYNLHTHTHYSDGKLTVEDYVKQAVALDLGVLGFSDHSPLPFDTYFSMKEENYPKYIEEIRAMKEKYAHEIKLYSSLEMDYIPQCSMPFHDRNKEGELDYIIGSVHLVGNDPNELWFIDGPKSAVYDQGLNEIFGGDIQKAVKTYFYQLLQMIQDEDFQIIGHLDKVHMHNKERFFSIKDNWYRKLYREVLDQVKASDIVMEVNTRGLYKGKSIDTFPNMDVLLEAKKMEIPICISSDAHHPDELQKEVEYAETRIRIAQYGEHYYWNEGSFKSVSLF